MFLVLGAVLAAVATAGCGRSRCPEGMRLDPKRSRPGEVAFCVSSTDATRAARIQLHPGGAQRRELCPFLGPRPGGRYQAWHANGAPALDGRYQDGLKTGVWTQWAADGDKIATGEYRDGQLVAGAPVGANASCETVAW